MRIGFRKFSSLKSEAKRLGADYLLVQEYQAMRKRWKDAVRYYSKKYGGIESVDIPSDIRQFDTRKGWDVNEFLESRIETIRSRLSDSVGYLNKRQRDYLSNVIQYLEKNSGVEILTRDNIDALEKMGARQLGALSAEIGTDFFDLMYRAKRSAQKAVDDAIRSGEKSQMKLDAIYEQAYDKVMGGKSIEEYADIIRRHL